MATTSFANPISGFAPAGQAIVQKPDGSATAYATLTAAKTAAASGDIIAVGPGTYDEANLAKDGVNWYFYPGAIVNSTSGAVGIWDDSAAGANGSVNFRVDGFGEFYLSGTNSALGVLYNTALSTMRIRCLRIDGGPNCAIYQYSTCVSSIIEVDANVITSSAKSALRLDSTASPVTRISARRIYSDTGKTLDLLRCGTLYVTAENIEMLGVGGYETGFTNEVINCSSSTGKIFIHANEIVGSCYNASAVLIGSSAQAEVHITCPRIENTYQYGNSGLAVTSNSGALVYVDADYIKSAGREAGLYFASSASTLHVNARRIEMTNGGAATYSALTAVGTGPIYLHGSTMLISPAGSTDSLHTTATGTVAVMGRVVGNKALNASVTLLIGTVANGFAVFDSSDVA